jgi:hypothetical protein
VGTPTGTASGTSTGTSTGSVLGPPTQIDEIPIDGDSLIRVATADEGFAVAWRRVATEPGTTVSRFDDANGQQWQSDVGSGPPRRLRCLGDQVYLLTAANELFVLDEQGLVVHQWEAWDPSDHASDFALTPDHLLIGSDHGSITEFRADGTEVQDWPAAPNQTSIAGLAASLTGYCVTGDIYNETDPQTACFDWNGAQVDLPMKIEHRFWDLEDRDHVSLSDAGRVGYRTLGLSAGDVDIIWSVAPFGSNPFGSYQELDAESNAVKTFVGPEGRTMWLEIHEWCDGSCHDGIRIGMLDFDNGSPVTWISQPFEVEVGGTDPWAVALTGDKIIVGTDWHLYVLSGG